MTDALYYDVMDSPIGEITLVASDKGLCAVLLAKSRDKYFMYGESLEQHPKYPVLMAAKKQLGEYFAGKRVKFDVKLDARGTVFQMKAWKELQKIPYASTISYGEQAKRMGDAKKARAAGMANGRNPLCIIVPCHRVIGTNGTLTGYAGGVKIKEYLINLERKHAA